MVSAYPVKGIDEELCAGCLEIGRPPGITSSSVASLQDDIVLVPRILECLENTGTLSLNSSISTGLPVCQVHIIND